MTKAKRDILLLILEVVILEILTCVLYFIVFPADIYGFVATKYLIDIVEDYLYEIMSLWLIFILVLGFAFSWTVLIVKWKGLKNVHLKLLIIWPVWIISYYVEIIVIALTILKTFSGTKYLTS